MNVPGDDHQGTKVELARDGEEVHCWQTSLEEVVASVFDLMGKTTEPQLEEQLVRNRVDEMFNVRMSFFQYTMLLSGIAVRWYIS